MDTVRGEDRVRCMDRVAWKLTSPCVKQTANRNLLYVLGNSNRGSVSTERCGMGREMGRRFWKEGTYVHIRLFHAEF